ncbi:MAG: GNAT family N-acetyltransferase [Sedimentisphaerales bacterium]
MEEQEAFARLEKEWDHLCNVLENYVTVFASFIWYRNWWGSYGAEAKLRIFVMWEGDSLVGIAPLMWKRYNLHGVKVRRIGFIQNNQSLHNDFIVLPEYRAIFLLQLIQSLFEQSSQWDELYFRNFPLSSENYASLAQILEAEGKSWKQNPNSIDSPYLIPAGGWQAFFSGRSRRTRKSLNNIKNRIRKAGKVSVKNFTTWEEFLSCKEDMFAVVKQSWAERIGDSLVSSVNWKFFEALAYYAAEKGWLSIWALYLDSKMIAVEFHLKGYGKEHALRGHYNPELAALSPGTFLEMSILEHVFTESAGVHVYDFCGSFENYKKKWTDTSNPHCDIHIYKKTVYSKFIRFHELIIEPRIRMIFHFANILGRPKSSAARN